MKDLKITPPDGFEKWLGISGYNNYLVSDKGNVFSVKSGKILKQSISTGGYPQVNLSENFKRKSINVHRLVAESFIKTNNNKLQVNHIDEDKTNNNVLNLEWVTPKSNCNHGERNNLIIRNRKGSNAQRKVLLVLNETDSTEFESISSLARFLNVKPASVKRVCDGHRKTLHGKQVKYK